MSSVLSFMKSKRRTILFFAVTLSWADAIDYTDFESLSSSKSFSVSTRASSEASFFWIRWFAIMLPLLRLRTRLSFPLTSWFQFWAVRFCPSARSLCSKLSRSKKQMLLRTCLGLVCCMTKNLFRQRDACWRSFWLSFGADFLDLELWLFPFQAAQR